MTTSYLERLLAERDGYRADATRILDLAAAEERSLTDSEQATLTDLQTRVDTVTERAQPLIDAEQREATFAARRASLDLARRTSTVQVGEERGMDLKAVWATAGDYARDVHDAYHGSEQARSRIERAMARYRAGENTTTTAAGLIPEPIIVGPLIDTIDASRPIINSLGVRGLPAGAGKTFSRPLVSQHAQTGEQVGDLDLLAQRAMTFTSVDFTIKWFGGRVTVSKQAVEQAPGFDLANVVYADLLAVSAEDSEKAVAAGLPVGITQTDALPLTATFAEFVAAVFAGAATIRRATNRFPTTLWVGTDRWVQLGSYTTPEGRLTLDLSPTNQTGNPLGLQIVVSQHLGPKAMILGDATRYEYYQSSLANAMLVQPGNFATEVGVMWSAAHGNVLPGAFVAFTEVVGATRSAKA